MKETIAGNLKSKTSWAAVLLMALGGLEQSGLLELVPDEYKGMSISAIGALMLFLRNITTQAVTDKANKQSGHVRPLMLALLFAVSVPAALSLQACATSATKPQDVISLACSPSDAYLIERCAEAVGDVYGVFQGRALEIVSDPTVPPDVKSAIQKLDRELTPAVRTLVQTSIAYIQLRAASAPEANAKRAELALQLANVQPKVQTLPKL